MSRTISIGVRPGRTARMSQSNVMKSISRARSVLTSVCGLSMPGSYTPTVTIYVVPQSWAEANWPSLRKHPWEACAVAGNIYINYNARAKTVDRMTTIVIHEILHTWGYANAPALGHNTKHRWFMMYVSGSKTNFFAPEEVLWLQRKYGRPRSSFYVKPIQKCKFKIADFKKKKDSKQVEKWQRRLDSLRYQWKRVPGARM